MNQNSDKKKASLSDYISLLIKWKNLFLSIMFIALLTSIVISLLLPKQYRATTTFMVPAQKDFGFGNLGGLLSGGSSALDIGASLLGVTNTNEDMIIGFIISRPIISQIASKYNLYDYYSIDDYSYEDLAKAFLGDLQVDPNEYGFIEVNVINEDPVLAAKMANELVKLADSLNIHFNTLQAKSYKDFVEKRYLQTLTDLKNAEDAYYTFQKENGVIDIPEQVKAMVESTSKLEAQVIQAEILLASTENAYGKNTPQYLGGKFNLEQLKSELKKLYGGRSKDDFFISIQKIPELQIEYLRLYRELEIQNQTLQYIYPIVEQARLDEKKNMPTIIVISEAHVPSKKYSPKRMFIVLGVVFFTFCILVIIIFRAERVINLSNNLNTVEKTELKMYKYLSRRFGI